MERNIRETEPQAVSVLSGRGRAGGVAGGFSAPLAPSPVRAVPAGRSQAAPRHRSAGTQRRITITTATTTTTTTSSNSRTFTATRRPGRRAEGIGTGAGRRGRRRRRRDLCAVGGGRGRFAGGDGGDGAGSSNAASVRGEWRRCRSFVGGGCETVVPQNHRRQQVRVKVLPKQ